MSENYKRESLRCILSIEGMPFFFEKEYKNPPFQESIERGILEIL